MMGQTSDEAVAICDWIPTRSDDSLAPIVAGASLDRAVVEVPVLHAFVTMANKTAMAAPRRVIFDAIPVVLKPVGLPIVSSDLPQKGEPIGRAAG